MAQAPFRNKTEPAKGPVWKRGAPGEVLEANKPLLAKLKRLIKQDRRADVLDIVRSWPPADVMELTCPLYPATAPQGLESSKTFESRYTKRLNCKP